MPFGSYLKQIELSYPGWRQPRMVEVSNLTASWEINGPGRLSAFIPADTLFWPGDVKGAWVWWEHPTQGIWAGIVQDDPADLDQGTVELSCVGLAEMLNWLRSPRTYRQQSAPAGALAKRALVDAEYPVYTWITTVNADEDGESITLEWRADLVGDIWRSLASQSGHEWQVTVDSTRTITANWRKQLGEDKRGRVLLAEGHHIIGGRLERSSALLVNDLLAVADDSDYEQSQAHVVIDKDSIQTYNRRQGVQRYRRAVTEATLRPLAERDLETMAAPVMALTIRTKDDLRYCGVPFDPPMYGVKLREGDRCRVLLATGNAALDFRVTGRAVDLTRGEVTYTGTATEL